MLQLVRHAKSSWSDPDLADLERPLSGRGRRAAAALADHVRERGELPDLVLCSPAARARQTLAAMEAALAPGTEVRVERAIYDGPAANVLDLVQRAGPTTVASAASADASATVMVVGHNPTLHDLALLLAGSGGGLERFPTGTFATLVSDGPANELKAGSARLAGLWTPRPPVA